MTDPRAALADPVADLAERLRNADPRQPRYQVISAWLAERGVLLVTEERLNAIIREKGAEWWAAFEADGYDGVADVLWAALSGEVKEPERWADTFMALRSKSDD